MPNNCCVNSTVIASAAKQSRGHSTRPLHCFVARAPRPCIASSQGLLAMTVNGGVRVPRVDFLISGLRLIAEGRRWLSAYIAARQPKWRKVGRVPDVVGSRLPRPYHFRARIQSFQAVAAPFPVDATVKLL